MKFQITLSLESEKNVVFGSCDQNCIASLLSDNEENAKRLADQMISELFRRYHEKTKNLVPTCVRAPT